MDHQSCAQCEIEVSHCAIRLDDGIGDGIAFVSNSMDPQIIDATGLSALRESSPDLTVLDVRLPDAFNACHLPGAHNNCVFEVAFPSRMSGHCPDLDKPVCVYGDNPGSHESRVAAEKLIRAGYTQVFEFRDGIEAWQRAGLPLLGASAVTDTPAEAPRNGHYSIDAAESTFEWLGRNLLNKHWGTAPIVSGHIDLTDGIITAGEFEIDLTRMECTDLRGSPLHDVLIAHLQSDDFFDTERHPTATVVVTRSEHVPGTTAGGQNVKLHADLTLRGETHPIEFTASAGLTSAGKLAAQAAFAIDRTRWGVIYGSGRLFSRLAGHLVNDLIEVQVRIVCS